MKVVHVIGSLESGGAERSLDRLVRATPADIRHEIITFRSGGWLEAGLREAGVSVTTVPLQLRSVRRGVTDLRAALAASDADLIHPWMHHSCVLTSMAAPRDVPLVWGIRTMAQPWRERPTTAAAMLASVAWARRASAIVYNSHVADRTHWKMGYPAATGVVIHNGYDAAALTASAAECVEWRGMHGIPVDAQLLLQVGRFHPVKGHRFLLEVLRQSGVLDSSWHVAFVGRADGVSETALRQLAARAGLEGRFHLVPETSQVRVPLSAANLVVVPSLWGESFPNAVAEAMCCGTAVVASDLGDASLIVGDCGVIVPAGDRAAWVTAIQRATRRPDLAALGARSRERIEQNFSLEKFSNRYSELLSHFAGARSGAP